MKTFAICQNELIVACHKLSNASRRAFSIAARQSRILWQIICAIRPLKLTVLGIS